MKSISPGSPADSVLDAIRRRSAALVAKSTDALMELMHPEMVYVSADGNVLSRDEYLARYVLPDEVRWISQTIDEPRVAHSGDTAVATFLVHDVARAGEYELDDTFRSTQTWVRGDGGWRCLAAHTSRLASDA
jgi:ketosteroid isomerase-like protein